MVAFVLNRADLVGKNSVECLDLLETMRDLGKHVITLYPHLSDQDEKLRSAICLITEGSIMCCDYTNSGLMSRYPDFVKPCDNSCRSEIICIKTRGCTANA